MSQHEELQKAIAAADPDVMKKVSDFLDKCVEKNDPNAAPMKAAATGISRIAHAMKGKISPEAMHGLLDAVGFNVTNAPAGAGEGEAGGAGAMSVGTAPSHGENKEAGFQALPAEMLEKMKSMDGKGQMDHLEKLGYRKYPDAQPAMKNKSGEAAGEEKNVEKTATAQLDAATQTKLDEIFKSHEKLVTENKELRTELAALTQVNKQRDLVQKAAAYAGLGLPQESIVATLSDAQKAGPEALERITKMYDAMNERVRVEKSFGGSLFGEIGTTAASGSGGSSESSWARIEKAAEGFVQKSGLTNVSKEAAVAKFLETPEGLRLYQEHQASRKDGI